MLPRPNPVNRQNSSPHIGRSAARKSPALRSKTPPAKFVTPVSHHSSKASNFQSSQPFTFPRAAQKQATSSENSSKSSSCRSTDTSELSKDSIMDIKYNLYCQANLMVLHSKEIREENEGKMIQELENLELSLLELDDKMTTLDTDLEKIRFFKKVRNDLRDKIENYEKVLNTVDEKNLDGYIRILEEDLGRVQLKNFSLPETENDAREIFKCIDDIDKELKQMPEIEGKISPLTQLHTSWLEVKRNVQKEDDLKKICEQYLKTAEELIYDHCFQKILEQEPSAIN